MRLRIDPPGGTDQSTNTQMINLIVRAHAARDHLIKPCTKLDIAQRRELRRTARAAYLAPDIVTALFQGRQPQSLTARKLERTGKIAICWQAQRRMFGFG